MKKILAAVLAIAMVLSMAACTESSSSVSDSSIADSSSSADSQQGSTTDSSSQSSETETTTTTTTTTTKTEYSYETEATTKQTQKGEKTTTTRDTTPSPAPVGIDMKTVAKQVLGAKELKITDSPKKTYQNSLGDKPGKYSFVSDIKTSELFDPFDDLYLSSSQKALENAKKDVQIMLYANAYEVTGEDGPDVESDGMIFALNFNCKDEDEAKKVYSLVLTEEMKENAKTDADKPVYDFGTDHAIVKVKDHSDENITMCYYRIKNNVLAVALYTVNESAFRELKPKNYTKQNDYNADLDNFCKAFGVSKLPSSLNI